MILAHLAALALASCGSVQQIQVTNHVPLHVSPSALRRDEHAVEIQSVQVARVWDSPCVQFTNTNTTQPGAWPLSIQASASYQCGRGILGCHDFNTDATPAGVVYTPFMVVGATGGWRQTLDHESLETVTGHEICDRVEDLSGAIDQTRISDYMLPHRSGDAMHFLRHRVGRRTETGQG